jgi:hypothetical protein
MRGNVGFHSRDQEDSGHLAVARNRSILTPSRHVRHWIAAAQTEH